MNDRKTPDDNLEDSFNEDFEFVEEHAEPQALPTIERKRSGKKLLVTVVLIVFIIAGWFGYRFYAPSTLSKPIAAASAPIQIAVTPPVEAAKLATKAPQPTVTKPEKELTAAEIGEAFSAEIKNPAPSAAKESAAPKEAAPATPTAAVPAPSAATTPPIPVATAPEPPKEHTGIQELFAPIIKTPQVEKPKETTTTEAPVAKETIKAGDVAALNEALNKLNQQMEYNMNQIKYLDSYTQEIAKTMTKLNESISAMDNRLLGLSNSTKTLSKEVGSVRQVRSYPRQMVEEEYAEVMEVPVRQSRRAPPVEACIEEPEYMVHAVIPGRAWLKSPKGQILTVTEGEVVGNYGKILVIDAANGVVLTSSGVTFR